MGDCHHLLCKFSWLSLFLQRKVEEEGEEKSEGDWQTFWRVVSNLLGDKWRSKRQPKQERKKNERRKGCVAKLNLLNYWSDSQMQSDVDAKGLSVYDKNLKKADVDGCKKSILSSSSFSFFKFCSIVVVWHLKFRLTFHETSNKNFQFLFFSFFWLIFCLPKKRLVWLIENLNVKANWHSNTLPSKI